jgi:hypothetical protein
MLEQRELLLQPCTVFPASGDGPAAALTPDRTVRDPFTGATRGLAGWRPRGRPWWLGWAGRPVLAVHEGDDAPLLFTVHRLWGLGPHWEVRDADGRAVGRLAGPLLKDRFGRNLALFERAPGGAARVRDAAGRELMALEPLPGGTRLTFADPGEGNPFQKMLLLAAALVL